ncbi:UrcA family protein [Sphingomonas sp. GB1N7]|uniref:UrcA family protein n=1 Tax=Parasphingomonas caseinilytica TaxID=3096158 RepID=UPI002FCC9C88
MKIAFTLAALAAATLVTPAFGQEIAPATRSQIVHHADLDLRRAADIRRLDRRIGIAVRAACGTASDLDLAGQNEVTRCRKDTDAMLSARRAQAIAAVKGNASVALAEVQARP